MPDPTRIGKYNILERIGRGGMGHVYRALDPLLKREVALKTMLKDLSSDEDLRTRFSREAQSAGGLRHPNIVTIYDLGADDEGTPYIAMEFLTGTDLENVIKNKIELVLLKKLDVIIQTGEGLAYAHSKGIVHRDIKPANIRLLDNGEVKIMDFGIAKIAASHFTRTGMIMGTPHYMAPEQIRGEKVDGRADIFSLGVVLYELLVFRKPYPGDNPTTVLFKIIHSEPEPLTDAHFTPPEGLEEAVLRALAKNPDERYQTCEEFTSDLLRVFERVQSSEPTSIMATPDAAQSAFSLSRTPLPRRSSGTPRPSTTTARAKSVPPITPPDPAAATVQKQSSPVQQPATPSPEFPVVLPKSGPGSAGKEISSPANITGQTVIPPVSPFSDRKWLLIGAAGLMGILFAGILFVGNVWKSSDPEPPQPPVKTSSVEPARPVPEPAKPAVDKVVPVTPPANGWLSLNIQPWAEIRTIKNDEGNVIPSPAGITPCKIQLEEGKYVVTLENSQFQTLVIQVEIQKDQTTLVHRKMAGFDSAKAVDSLGL